ncbi:MAG: ABC transporter substrate-binding protein [Clostridia bacterium]|nr:ABC transporter substrate-binding protein [Clostridia bacterium]
MKKILSVLLVMALLVSFAGCGNVTTTQPSAQASTPAPSQGPFSVTDSRGTEIKFDKLPQKVISLMPSDTEIIYALGSGDQVIADSDYCNYPEDAAKKQKLPTGDKLNIEQLISLKPDVLFLGKMSVMEDQVKQIEAAGIKVVVTEANSLEDTYKVISLIGTVLGKDKEATSLVTTMKNGFDEIRASVKDKTPATVYVEVSPLQYGLWSCGKNTFVQELIDIVGAKNVFADVEGWAQVSEEQVLQRNPAIIFTTASPLTGIQDPIGDITGRPNWDKLDAVKNKKVIMLDADMLSRPGPRLLDAARDMVKAIYQ